MAKLFTKFTFALAIALLFAPSLFAQQSTAITDSAHLFIDTALKFAKKHSIYRDKADWAKISDVVWHSAANARSVKDAIPSLQLMFTLLGDHHGSVVYKGKFYRMNGWKSVIDTSSHLGLLKKYKQDNVVRSAIFDHDYGYLLIPDNNPTKPGDVDSIARQIRDTLNKLHPEKLKGLIIDLRVNPGGDMYAMLGGLSNLFTPGNLGSFIDPVNKKSTCWSIKDYAVYYDTLAQCKLKPSGLAAPYLKTVVLLSPETKSSGEATAISFKGRKNTYFIGENTGGYTTANSSFQFTNETGLFLSSSIEADRNGHIYWDYISPDEEIIGGDNYDDPKADKKIIAALKWLKTR